MDAPKIIEVYVMWENMCCGCGEIVRVYYCHRAHTLNLDSCACLLTV